MTTKSRGEIPLRPEVHERLDARLQALLRKLQSDDLHGEVSAESRQILDDHTHESVRLTTGEKLLGPNWERDWQATPNELAFALFGDTSRDKLAQSLHAAFKELIRLVLDSTSAFDKERNGRTLREALRCYLSRNGYGVPTADAGSGQNQQTEEGGRKRRGRKKADYETVQREAKLFDKWQRAREADDYRADFADQNKLTVKELDKLLDRVAARKRRSDK